MKQSKLFFSGIIISLLAGFAVQPAAEAFSSADLAAVTGGQNCSHADLSHANLSGADLTGLDLTGANLENANLTGARLERTILDKASLRAAN